MVDASYEVRRKVKSILIKKRTQKDDIFSNAYPQNVIKIRDKLIRSRLSGLLVDMNEYNNSTSENDRKNKIAKEFVEDLQRAKKEEILRK